MHLEINDEIKCTGCAACVNICPKKCIIMKDDESGFSYPFVYTDNCIDCGMCINVCPIIHPIKTKDMLGNQEVYAGWSKDEMVRYNSTSGGVFSELAQCILNEKGYVSGAVYDIDCDIVHAIVSDNEGLKSVRQSKYSQSNIGFTFQEIKKLLAKKETVLFCGAPCQVAGLKKSLQKEYENLVTLDFICRGVNSPKAYKSWLRELEEKYNSKVVNVWFKYKKYGWNKSPKCTRIDFQNGKTCVQNSYKNVFMRGYLGPNLYIRPSCGDCKFKDRNRNSDITLADFWGVAKTLDDDKGTSLILLNSEKGKRLFNECKPHIYYEQRDINEIIEGNRCFQHSVVINPKSKDFLKELNQVPFSKLIEKYAKVSVSKRIIGKIKRGLRKLIK